MPQTCFPTSDMSSMTRPRGKGRGAEATACVILKFRLVRHEPREIVDGHSERRQKPFLADRTIVETARRNTSWPLSWRK